MPEYTYKCFDCEHQFDIVQSIKDSKLHKCPNCKHLSLERIIYPATIIMDREPTTLGQLADKNTKRAGKEKIQLLEEQNKERNKRARKEIQNGKQTEIS